MLARSYRTLISCDLVPKHSPRPLPIQLGNLDQLFLLQVFALAPLLDLDPENLSLSLSHTQSLSRVHSRGSVLSGSYYDTARTANIANISEETLIEPETAPLDEPFISEEVEDLLDCRCGKHDSLSGWSPWWMMEYVPLTHRYQVENNTWVTKWRYVCLLSCEESYVGWC